MIKKTIEFKDFNGNDRKEDHYFNLSEAELIEMEYGIKGGYNALIQQIIESQDTPSIMKVFKEIIMKSYGKKSLDGSRFEKSEEITNAFLQSNAYNTLFMEFMGNPEGFASFLAGIIPKDVADKVAEQEQSAIAKE